MLDFGVASGVDEQEGPAPRAALETPGSAALPADRIGCSPDAASVHLARGPSATESESIIFLRRP
jgi:hypothetical protein